ncbi:hypothetical protein [Crystallibacter degradans]|uniref:hypothetical protein n=1 Tax=Crystallibacter degradans TaxID=2726743 RepID=UPI001474C84E|nr:hypothetical protein [Arthrobacter sp. SF27]NMR31862.1 hypothetical protein [Arthrobacter sp. SF27]
MLLPGFYPAVPWLAYICAGIAIGRLNLTSKRVALTLLGAGSALAACLWTLSAFLLGPAGEYERLVAATPDLGADGVQEILALGADLPAKQAGDWPSWTIPPRRSRSCRPWERPWQRWAPFFSSFPTLASPSNRSLPWAR